MQTDFILDYWDSQARTYGDLHDASWRDRFAIELEIASLDRCLPGGLKGLGDGMVFLDVGCANGYSTQRIGDLRPQAEFVGVDFSAQMIAAAHANEQIRYTWGDVRDLPFGDESFDALYTTRVLINLPTWPQQMQAIDECLRVVRPGGTVCFCEGFWEPQCTLNALRAVIGLPPLGEPVFNRLLWKRNLDALLDDRGLRFEVDAFSGLYQLGSRFVRELVGEEGYQGLVNASFADLALEGLHAGGKLAIQQTYIVHV